MAPTPRPKGQAPDGRGKNHTLAQRIQALSLAEASIDRKQATALSGLHNT